MSDKKNQCIRCNVNSCKNHCDCDNYCSLDAIVVGTHEDDPAMNQCTDCRSFVNENEEEQSRAVKETYEQEREQNEEKESGFWGFMS